MKQTKTLGSNFSQPVSQTWGGGGSKEKNINTSCHSCFIWF
jgi:hypothetical protein